MEKHGPQDKTKLWISALIIAIAALWIRVNYVQHTLIDNPIRGDAANYVQYALNMVNHHTFSKSREVAAPTPDAYWAPGYPALIATAILMEKKFGTDTYQTVIYTQTLIGTLIAILTLLLGRQFLPHYWALFSAIFVAFNPHMISLGNYILTETLLSLLFLSAIYIFVLAFKKKSIWLFCASSLLFGASYLVNPVVFFTPIIFSAVALLLYKVKQQEAYTSILKLILPGLIIFFVCVGSWSLRGVMNVPQDAQSSSSRLLTNLIIGSHESFYRLWRENPRNPDNPATLDEKQLNGSYTAFANLLATRIAEDPLHYAYWYLIQKPILLWDWNILVGQGDIYVYPVEYSLYHVSKPAILTYSITRASYYWLLACAFLGVIFLWRSVAQSGNREAPPLFIYSALIYVSSVYIITQAEARYSIPFRPLMYLASAYFLYKAWGVIEKSKVKNQQAVTSELHDARSKPQRTDR